MKTITYSWRGTGSMRLALSIDGKPKEIQFNGGIDRPKVNSSFGTSDEAIQKAIEATNLFEKGLIVVRSSKVVEVEKAKETTNESQKLDSSSEENKKPDVNLEGKGSLKGKFPSVKTIQQAADKLHEKFEVPLNELNSPDAILAKADALGASFPNLVM